jgi:hypothetical protein
MSAFGPKRTSLVAPHMSALGGKADMPVCARVIAYGKGDRQVNFQPGWSFSRPGERRPLCVFDFGKGDRQVNFQPGWRRAFEFSCSFIGVSVVGIASRRRYWLG